MAFQQPLVPVLPVARELIAKTKWIKSSSHNHIPESEHHRSSSPSLVPFHGHGRHHHNGTAGSATHATASSTTLPSAPATPTGHTSGGPQAGKEATTPTSAGPLKRRRTRSLFSLRRNRVSSPPPVPPVPPMPIVAAELSSEPDSGTEQPEEKEKQPRRPRVLSVFRRRQHSAGVRASMESDMSSTSVRTFRAQYCHYANLSSMPRCRRRVLQDTRERSLPRQTSHSHEVFRLPPCIPVQHSRYSHLHYYCYLTSSLLSSPVLLYYLYRVDERVFMRSQIYISC